MISFLTFLTFKTNSERTYIPWASAFVPMDSLAQASRAANSNWGCLAVECSKHYLFESEMKVDKNNLTWIFILQISMVLDMDILYYNESNQPILYQKWGVQAVFAWVDKGTLIKNCKQEGKLSLLTCFIKFIFTCSILTVLLQNFWFYLILLLVRF